MIKWKAPGFTMENAKENGFLDIPEEVYYSNLWPLLNQNELLRMRTVCQTTRKWVEGYLDAKSNRTPVMEINEGDKNLAEYLQLEISTARLFLNNSNSGPFYFENNRDAVAMFLEKHGSKITHLRVTKQCRVLTSGEVEFLKGLKNLKILLVDDWIKRPLGLEHDPDLFGANQPWPTLLRHLTEFGAGVKSEATDESGYEEINRRSLKYSHPLTTPNIIKLALPFAVANPRPRGASPTPYFNSPHKFLTALTEQLIERQQSDKFTLKSFSFNMCCGQTPLTIELILGLDGRDDNPTTQTFLNFMKTCSTLGITLENVRRDWLGTRRCRFHIRDHEQYLNCIASMVTEVVPLTSFSTILPCLQRLDIFTSFCYQIIPIAVMPELKILNIVVRNTSGDRVNRNYFDNLFYDCVHENLEALSLIFNENCTWVPPPMALNRINLSCQRINRLKICNWSQPTTSWSNFFERMPLLEELHLKNCRQLGDDVLVAARLERLTNLKRIVLADLDKMPGITDAFLREVVSRKSLTHFIVSSEEPVASITVAGIRSLLDGPFAESIWKFPFKRWSLTSCTKEEWIELSKEFRSYYL